MTGYGGLDLQQESGQFRLEIRSWNHRFTDLKIRAPKNLVGLEPLARQIFQTDRGSIEIKITPQSNQVADPLENQFLIEIEEFKRLKKLFDQSSGSPPTQQTAFSDFLSYRSRPYSNANQPSENTLEAKGFEAALRKLRSIWIESKQAEGQHLMQKLGSQVALLKKHYGTLKSRQPEVQSEWIKKITQRINEIFKDLPTELKDSRILQESAYLLEKADVAEELDRMESHLHAMDQLFTAPSEPVGKKLEFVIQELNREVNTFNNKCSNVDLQAVGVEMKLILEKIREQGMNLE